MHKQRADLCYKQTNSKQAKSGTRFDQWAIVCCSLGYITPGKTKPPETDTQGVGKSANIPDYIAYQGAYSYVFQREVYSSPSPITDNCVT